MRPHIRDFHRVLVEILAETCMHVNDLRDRALSVDFVPWLREPLPRMASLQHHSCVGSEQGLRDRVGNDRLARYLESL